MLLLIVLAVLNPVFEPPDLTFLCDDNFSSYLLPIRNALLLFKSENCQYCKLMYPALKEVARKLRYRGLFGIVDVDKCRKMRLYYNASSYPLLLYVKHRDQMMTNAENLGPAAFARRVLTHPTTDVCGFHEIQEAADRNRSFFLVDHKLSPAEEEAIDPLTPEHRFMTIDSFDSIPLTFGSRIVFYRSADRQFVDVGDELSTGRIREFLFNGTKPIFVEFTPERLNDLVVQDVHQILVRFDANRDAISTEQFQLLTDLGKNNMPIFFFPAEQSSIFDDIVNPPGCAGTVVAILRISGNRKSRWILNVPDQKSIGDVVAGKTPEYRKSEEAPRDNSGRVKRIVGSTFDPLVLGSQLPFVLLLYSVQNYALQRQMEQLGEAAETFNGKANFGFLDTESNEVSIELRSDLPVFVIVSGRKVSVFSKDVKLPLVEWIRRAIGQTEL
jgi:thiol-disulfide isomerase/thioredoxin